MEGNINSFTNFLTAFQEFELNHPKAPFLYAIMSYLILSIIQGFVKTLANDGVAISYVLFLRGIICWSINLLISISSGTNRYSSEHLQYKLFFRSLLGSVCAINFITCLEYLDFGVANSIWMTSPIYAYFADYILFNKPILFTAIICTITSFLGVLLIINPFKGLQLQGYTFYYQLWCLIMVFTSLGNAFAGAMLGWFKKDIQLGTILNYFYLANMFVSASYVTISGSSLPLSLLLQPWVIIRIGFVGCMFYFSNAMYQRSVCLRSASQIQPLQYILVVSGLIQDICLFGGVFSVIKVIGLIIVLSSTGVMIWIRVGK